jgi:hypothetical protein
MILVVEMIEEMRNWQEMEGFRNSLRTRIVAVGDLILKKAHDLTCDFYKCEHCNFPELMYLVRAAELIT